MLMGLYGVAMLVHEPLCEETRKALADLDGWLALAVVCGGYVIYRVISSIVWKIRVSRASAAGQEILDARNNVTFNFAEVSAEVRELLMATSTDVAEIRRQLLAGALTSVDLVNFYGARTQDIARKQCYSGVENFHEAMELAQKCDEERQQARAENRLQDLPFVHGVPISVKEYYQIKG
jgi:hypothetical protein